MRIAYIAPYQGATLKKSRPSLHNSSLAARMKIALIAELLKRNSHEVEILSQGDVDRYEFKFYPSIDEMELFHPEIPIIYASSVPVRFINGLWSSWQMLALFRRRHRIKPFDAVIIYNLKRGHVACARFAGERLGLPVILEYNDDSFADIWGGRHVNIKSKLQLSKAKQVLNSISGGMACSPYLLSQMPSSIPKLLQPCIVSDEIANLIPRTRDAKKNWVVFSGTHEGAQGLTQLVQAWQMLAIPNWELHFAGCGPITKDLEALAKGNVSIVFHGLLDKRRNAELLCAAKIGMNPQDVTKIPGNTFPFKIIEYLAAGLHVVSTPRGALEADLNAGITYIPDNSPETLASSLKKVIEDRVYQRTATESAIDRYGTASVGRALNQLFEQVMSIRIGRTSAIECR